MARFAAFFSGSSGNCTYMGTSEEGILIDAGVSAKKITEMLARAGISVGSLRAIFVTHEHSDHIRGLRVFASRHQLPVYASPGTLRALVREGVLDGVLERDAIGKQGIRLQTMSVTPFRTSHDAAESVGYRVQFSDGRTAAVATDTGLFTPDVLAGVRGADLVLLESNYDVRMLRAGAYPQALKQRIQSHLGHLSNTDSAAAALRLLETGTTRFVLGHLSRENNTPALARSTVCEQLTSGGAREGQDFLLSVVSVQGDGTVTVF